MKEIGTVRRFHPHQKCYRCGYYQLAGGTCTANKCPYINKSGVHGK